jgi:hypothetical protein
MITPLSYLLRLVPFLCDGHRQLAAYKRTGEAAEARQARSALLGVAVQGVGRLAAGPRHRGARHRPAVAAAPLPRPLDRKLGIVVADRTVSRLIPKRRTPPSQTWRTLLANHGRDLVAIDFFAAPTAGASSSSSSCSPTIGGVSSTSR